MSLVKRLIISAVALVSLLFGYYFLKQNNSNVASHKSRFTQSGFTSKGVINRTIEISLDFESPTSDSEKTEITSSINLPFAFSEKLFYRWHLSEGVILKEGSLTGEIPGLIQNSPKKTSITVIGFSKNNNRQIKFEIYGFKNSQKIYGDAIISSDMENTFENAVQNVERIKASE